MLIIERREDRLRILNFEKMKRWEDFMCKKGDDKGSPYKP